MTRRGWKNRSAGDHTPRLGPARVLRLAANAAVIGVVIVALVAGPASAAYLAENTQTNKSFTTGNGPFPSVTCHTQIQHGNYLTVPYSKIRWYGSGTRPCKRHWAENVYSANGQYFNAPLVWGDSYVSWAQSQGPSGKALLGSNFYLTPNTAVDEYYENVGQFTP